MMMGVTVDDHRVARQDLSGSVGAFQNKLTRFDADELIAVEIYAVNVIIRCGKIMSAADSVGQIGLCQLGIQVLIKIGFRQYSRSVAFQFGGSSLTVIILS